LWFKREQGPECGPPGPPGEPEERIKLSQVKQLKRRNEKDPVQALPLQADDKDHQDGGQPQRGSNIDRQQRNGGKQDHERVGVQPGVFTRPEPLSPLVDKRKIAEEPESMR
jgi:hypothetical protein